MKSLTLLLCLVPVLWHAQVIDSTITHKWLGPLECDIVKHITPGKTATHHMAIHFWNAETRVADKGEFFLTSQEEVDSLATHLQKAIPYIGKMAEVTFTGPGYRIVVPRYFNTVSLYDIQGRRMDMGRRFMNKWIAWLKENPLPR